MITLSIVYFVFGVDSINCQFAHFVRIAVFAAKGSKMLLLYLLLQYTLPRTSTPCLNQGKMFVAINHSYEDNVKCLFVLAWVQKYTFCFRDQEIRGNVTIESLPGALTEIPLDDDDGGGFNFALSNPNAVPHVVTTQPHLEVGTDTNDTIHPDEIFERLLFKFYYL